MSRRSDHPRDNAAAAQIALMAGVRSGPFLNGILQWLPFDLVAPIAAAGDFCVILLASVSCGLGYEWFFLHTTNGVDTYIGLGMLVAVNFSTFTATQRHYQPTELINLTRQIRNVALGWFGIFAFLTVVGFTLKVTAHFSRGASLSFFVLGLFGLLGFRIFLAEILARAMRSGSFLQQKYILIAERGQNMKSAALADLHRCGYRPTKIVEVSHTELSGASGALTEKLQDIIAASQMDPVQCVILLMRWSRPGHIDCVLHQLHWLPLPVYLLPDEYISTFLDRRLDKIGPTLAVELQRSPLTSIERTIKRVIDIFIATMMIVILSPLMVMTALLIKLDSSGPVLFKQRRNGFQGKAFSIYKFRSMHVLEDGAHISQARRNDPRVTIIGRWLRQTSVDELPQLFNVLKGDMSIVGPRPHAVAHNNQYQELVANYAFRHHVKPGITGWAQVNGFRGETPTIESMAKRIDHDLWYIDHWGIWLDVKILLKTLLLAFREPTAY